MAECMNFEREWSRWGVDMLSISTGIVGMSKYTRDCWKNMWPLYVRTEQALKEDLRR